MLLWYMAGLIALHIVLDIIEEREMPWLLTWSRRRRRPEWAKRRRGL